MAINIFGIKDSANLTIKNKVDGKVFLYADYATVTTNDWTSDNVYAKSKNVDAIRWDYNKKSTLKLSFEIFDLKILSMMAGSDFITGATDLAVREVLTVGTSNKASITSPAKVGSLLFYKIDDDLLTNLAEQTLGTPASTVNTYSLSSQEATFNATSCPVGSKVVAYYLKTSEATAKTLTVNADKFAANFMIVGDTYIRDTAGEDSFVQITWLNCKPKANWSITMSASDITKIDVEFDLFKDTSSSDMATYTIY